HHRNVVDVFDVGTTDDGVPFLVMELLHGETLRERLDRAQPLTLREALRIAIELAKGLEAAHACGVVHRDLKPGNVFLHHEGADAEPVVKVLDFGVSKELAAPSSTATGSLLGSPAYMSPEQARGLRTVDQRTDLWTFGVVLFEMFSGYFPFGGSSSYEIVAEI